MRPGRTSSPDPGTEVLSFGNFAAGANNVTLLPGTRLFIMNRSPAVILITMTPRHGPGTFLQNLGAAKWTEIGGDEWSQIHLGGTSVQTTWCLVRGKGGIFSGGLLALSAVQDGVQLGDSAGNPTGVSYASAAVCPATGIWHFVASVTAGELSIGDGTTTQQLVPTGTPTGAVTASTWYHFSVAVVAGTTYTLSGTGLIVMSAAGVITPA